MNVTASQARANFYKLLEQVQQDQEVVGVSHKGGIVYLVPEDEMNALRETLHLLGNRTNARRLFDSLDAVERGDVVPKSLADLEREARDSA